MGEYPWFVWHWMGKDNDSLWLWIDMKFGRFWYVFIWRKGSWPYCYRSTDATPPLDDERGNNQGTWLFGRWRDFG